MADLDFSEESSSDQTNLVLRQPSRFGKIAARTSWITFTLLLLVFFTALKIPEDRLKNVAQGYLSSFLAEEGISFTAAESKISIGLGISYELRNVTLRPPAPAQPVQLARLGVKPSILSLLVGKKAGKFWLEAGKGQASGNLSSRGKSLAISFEAEKLDLNQIGVPRLFSQISVSAILTGSGEISGNFADLKTLEGKMRVELKKLTLDQQPLMGFSIPRLAVSDSMIHFVIASGKIQIKELRLGREGATPPDDIRATVTGQVTLARDLSASLLDVKTRFSFSPAVLQSFALVDALLASGKRPDGSYAFQLNGPAYSPTPAPIKD